MPTTITIENALKLPNTLFIDTRTPNEFQEDHIPGAINLPILSNDERAIVGTIYKQVSQQDAIQAGVEFFSKKLPDFLKEVTKHKNKTLIINCWRGGMRSKTVVSLLDSLKFNVLQLEGGYKSYRAYIKERLYNYKLQPKVFILWGLTCTGKTSLLTKLPNALDLEGFAQHRGSMYGSVGLTPTSQKSFETQLYQRLEQLNAQPFIIIEGESRRIGDLMIPDFLWHSMNHGTHILINRSIDNRAKAAIEEYFKTIPHLDEIKTITQNLPRNLLSNKRKQEIVQLLDQNQLHDAAKILLQEYYDPLYQNTLQKHTYAFEINSDNEEKAVEEIVTQIQKIIYKK
jgi:tRNA 2-selenouridine synthase